MADSRKRPSLGDIESLIDSKTLKSLRPEQWLIDSIARETSQFSALQRAAWSIVDDSQRSFLGSRGMAASLQHEAVFGSASVAALTESSIDWRAKYDYLFQPNASSAFKEPFTTATVRDAYRNAVDETLAQFDNPQRTVLDLAATLSMSTKLPGATSSALAQFALDASPSVGFEVQKSLIADSLKSFAAIEPSLAKLASGLDLLDPLKIQREALLGGSMKSVLADAAGLSRHSLPDVITRSMADAIADRWTDFTKLTGALGAEAVWATRHRVELNLPSLVGADSWIGRSLLSDPSIASQLSNIEAAARAVSLSSELLRTLDAGSLQFSVADIVFDDDAVAVRGTSFSLADVRSALQATLADAVIDTRDAIRGLEPNMLAIVLFILSTILQVWLTAPGIQPGELRSIVSAATEARFDRLERATGAMRRDVKRLAKTGSLSTATAGQCVVTGDRVNIRAEPRKNGRLVGVLSERTIVSAIVKQGRWILVPYADKDGVVSYGWVSSKYLVSLSPGAAKCLTTSAPKE